MNADQAAAAGRLLRLAGIGAYRLTLLAAAISVLINR